MSDSVKSLLLILAVSFLGLIVVISFDSNDDADDPVYPSYVVSAVEAAAEFAAVDVDDVIVIEFGPITWRDGALGCPKPGMMYTQALIEGYRVILGVKDQHNEILQLAYHGRDGGTPFLCMSA